MDKVLVLIVLLIQLVQLVVGEVLVQGGVDGDLDAADLGSQVGLEVDELPGLGLHQVLAGDVGDVLLDLGGVAVGAAQGVGAEAVAGLSQELVGGGTAAGAGVAALGVHDDGVVHHHALLQDGVQAQSGGGGVAAGVGDEALALGQIPLDLGDAVHGLLGHLIVGVVQVVPLLPNLRVTEPDVGAEVDELLAARQHLLGNAAHGARVHCGKHDVAVLDDHIHGLVVQGQDLLVIETSQSGVLVLDLSAGGEAISQVGHLSFRVVHHKTEQLTTGIAGGTTDGKTDHDTIPPFNFSACAVFIGFHFSSQFQIFKTFPNIRYRFC